MGDQEALVVDVLSTSRIIFVFIAIIVPRALICVFAGMAGIEYLRVTRELADLMLNCMCLSFILNFDELLYIAFLSLQTKFLFLAISPLTIQKKYSSKSRLFIAPAKLIFMCASLAWLHLTHIGPMFTMMRQAINILCAGELNFVYTRNTATTVVLAAKSFEVADA